MAGLKIDIYSHNFAVTKFDQRGKEALFSFCKKSLVQWSWNRVDGRMVRELIRTYASSNQERSVFRFHINCYNDFIIHLENSGLNSRSFQIVNHPLYKPAVANFKLVDTRQAHDYQIEAKDYLNSPGRSKLVTLQTGRGKLAPLDAKIKIPGGWTTMGEVEIGSTVTAWDGDPTVVKGVYPQGVVQLYKVTFADGRSTECGAEHLWKVYYINTSAHKRWRIVNTLEMQRLLTMPNPRVYIPLINSEDCQDIDLPIPPYTLGVILGDGAISRGSITITKLDKDLFENIESELPLGLKITQKDVKHWTITGNSKVGGNEYLNSLRELGLQGCVAWTKFIPESYLHASTFQRKALLQGLMDTDGTIGKTGSSSYSTTSKKLAEDVQYLVRSLGGIASISSRTPTFSHKGEKKKGRLAYQVNIRVKKPSELFLIERKLKRTNDDNQYSANLKLRVMSVEPTTFKEAQCIEVDHPDRLYVTDDFIVTHNTFCELKAIYERKVRTVCIIKGMYVEKWKEDYIGAFGNNKTELMVIRGSKDLKNLIELAQAGELVANFIIITNTTMYNYLYEFERFNGDHSYGCDPIDFYPTLKAGIRLVDEVHQDFHLNFRMDLYTHIDVVHSLSATMEPDDPFIRKMYELAYPLDTRFKGIPFDKYISVKALTYTLNDPKRLKWQNWIRRSYSHVIYEQSLIKNPLILKNYLGLIKLIVENSFIKKRKPGQKMIIFAATVEMCTIITKYLRDIYTTIGIVRYTSDDEYEDLLAADISVSTLKSAGTALDIPGLMITLLTDNVNSRQANDQVLGRTRKMKGEWADVTPEFLYLVCNSIPKHLEYHQKKMSIFADKVLSHQTMETGIRV